MEAQYLGELQPHCVSLRRCRGGGKFRLTALFCQSNKLTPYTSVLCTVLILNEQVD